MATRTSKPRLFDFEHDEFIAILAEVFPEESKAQLRRILRDLELISLKICGTMTDHIMGGRTERAHAQRQLVAVMALELHVILSAKYLGEYSMLARKIATRIHCTQFPEEVGLTKFGKEAALSISDDRGRLAVIIRKDGIVRYAPWVTRDEASRMFWNAVEAMVVEKDRDEDLCSESKRELLN